jgi:ParB family chromosome partitioning protein
MAKDWSFMDLLNTESREAAMKTGYDEVDINDIEPNEYNFYDTSNVGELKESICEIGVQEPVIVNISHDGGGKKYRMVSGHRRLKACTELVDDGYSEFRYMPAIVVDITDPFEEKQLLIDTNSTQRVRSNWEKVKECMGRISICENRKKTEKIKGRVRDLVAEEMDVKGSQIGNYIYLAGHLSDRLMDGVFKDGKITLELAIEAARLEPDEQERLAEIAAECGTFTKEDIRRIVGSRVIKGQQSFEDVDEEYKDTVSEDEEYKETVSVGEEHKDIVSDRDIADFVTSEESTATSEQNSEENSTDSDNDASDSEESMNIVDESIKIVNQAETENVPVTGTFYYEQGEYELKLVDDLIVEYTTYRKTSLDKNDRKMIMRHCCILDGLKTIKELFG